MSHKKLRDLSIIVLLGLFVLTKNILFLWIIAFAAIALTPSSGRRSYRTRPQYEEDADSHYVRIPASRDVHRRLIAVYSRFETSKKGQPELSESFQEIIDSLWENLKLETDPREWRSLLDDVLRNWPDNKSDLRVTLESQMKKVQELSGQWAEARKEVFGKL